jgi:tRNA uridine 5-carboxymethylaminomethyl modification enzyme
LIAGLNAGFKSKDKEELVILRDQAFIGVLIDDLINFGASEPYRMFSSRSEYRLTLRHENSDFRLTPIALERGIIDEHRIKVFESRKNLKSISIEFLENYKLPSNVWYEKGLTFFNKDSKEKISISKLLRSNNTNIESIEHIWSSIFQIDSRIKAHIQNECSYKEYIEDQKKVINWIIRKLRR